MHNFSGKHLCGQHAWILGPRVACYSDYPGLVNARRATLFEEGAAFLRAGDSGKPAALIFEDLRREGFAQYQFSSIDDAAVTQNPRQLLEDCLAIGI